MAFGIGKVRVAAKRQSLQDALKAGPVIVQYRKVTADGNNRFAIATLNPKLYRYTFKGGGHPAPLGLIRYWDLGVGYWRSFYFYNVEAWTPISF
jgi:hypothetical protein